MLVVPGFHHSTALRMLLSLILAAFLLPPLAHAQMTVTVTVMTHGSAHLNWSPGEARPESGRRVASWDVYRASEAAGPFAFIASVPPSKTSYTDATVVPGRQYFYRVTAISAAGMESPPSAIVRGSCPASYAEKANGHRSGAVAGESSAVWRAFKRHGRCRTGAPVHGGREGYVVGLRFYKGVPNTGPHTGTLWSSSGEALATGTFADEKPSGWQTLMFGDPVLIQPRTTYVVSYHTAVGQYAYDEGYFTAGRDHAPLHAPKNAGVFLYGVGGFPDKSFKSTNYWIDPIFLPGQ